MDLTEATTEEIVQELFTRFSDVAIMLYGPNCGHFGEVEADYSTRYNGSLVTLIGMVNIARANMLEQESNIRNKGDDA